MFRLFSNSGFTWLRDGIECETANKIARINAQITDCLASDAFEPAVVALANRDTYADAATALQLIASPKQGWDISLLALLADKGDASFLFRTARVAGLISHTSAVKPIVTLGWLRERLPLEAARWALALAGECDWQRSSRTVRAAYLLQALFARMRKGLS